MDAAGRAKVRDELEAAETAAAYGWDLGTLSERGRKLAGSERKREELREALDRLDEIEREAEWQVAAEWEAQEAGEEEEEDEWDGEGA